MQRPSDEGVPRGRPRWSEPRSIRGVRTWSTLALSATVTLLLIASLQGAAARPALGSSPGTVGPSPPALTKSNLAPAYGDWTMFLGGPLREASGVGDAGLNSKTAPNLTLAWTYDTKNSIVTEPIVVNGVVYVGSEDGSEFAFNATTGKLLWKTFLGHSVEQYCGANQGLSSTPTYVNGDLYLGGGDGDWYALKASTGKILWNVTIGNTSGNPGDGYYNWASPLVVGDLAYVGVSSHCDVPLVLGGLDVVNITTQKIVGKFNTTQGGAIGSSIWSSPSYNSATNTIYVTTGNGPTNDTYQDAVIAINQSTLAGLSSWQTTGRWLTSDGDFGTTPTLFTDGKGQALVTAANKDGYLFAWNQSNLAAGPLWADRIASGATYSSTAIGHGILYVGSSKTTLGGHPINGSLRAITPSTGGVLWEDAFPGIVYAAPVWADGLVAVGGGNLFEVDNSTTGAVLFSYTLPSKVIMQASATIAHDWIYVGAKDGIVRAFSLPAGTGGSKGQIGPDPAWGVGSAEPLIAAARSRPAFL